MKINELQQKRQELLDRMQVISDEIQLQNRSLTTDENSEITEIEGEIKQIDEESIKELSTLEERNNQLQNELNQLNQLIADKEQIENRNIKMAEVAMKKNEQTKMSNLLNKILENRSGDTINNFSIESRSLGLSNGFAQTDVAGSIDVVGYKPFYQVMGVTIYPNLKSNLQLPYTSAIVAGKKAEGARSDAGSTISNVTLTPNRYTVTELIGKELLAVGNEQALNAYVEQMILGVDRAITKDIFDVIYSSATAVTGLTAYTTANIDTLVSPIDGNVKLLMPRAEFFKAKNIKIDTGSGLFLANKIDDFSGKMWDGTDLFYSNLFAPVVATTIVAADLKHVAVGEFGESYEILFNPYIKAAEGQVEITVVKLADVKVVNSNAVRKASIA